MLNFEIKSRFYCTNKVPPHDIESHQKQSTLSLCSLQNPFEEPYAAAATPAGYYQGVKVTLGQKLTLCVPASTSIAIPATEWSS